MEKQIVSVPSIEALHSISGGIIESGIKYIMFPLHLLRFCIFGMAAGSVDSEKRGEARPAKKDETRDKKRDEKSTKEREEKSAKGKEEKSKKDVDTSKDKSRESRRSSKSKEDSSTSKESSKLEDKNEESIDDMVTAEEDSDSSMEHWSNATCTLPTASMDYDNIERSMSHAIATEPMDISMEEQSHEKSYTATKTSRDVESKSSRLHAEERGSNSSVDEEIARIFQKQCTSSEDEVASDRCKPFVAHKRERTRQTNFLCNEKSNYSRSKEQQDNDRERTKKPSSDVAQHKRRKVTREEDRHERREEKHGSRHDTPSKHKSRSSRTPVKSKESKQRDTKYKETATQTDSAFSDDDVEMIPIDVKLADKLFCCKHAARRSLSNHLQSKEVEQELNYIADNEDSADGFKRVARKRISSCSTSSSSTDLGFDERVSATLETLSDNAFRICSRAPPGFPELPQNPPLTSSQQFVAVVALKDNYSPVVQTAANVPRAPSPMRHLYYNYPEFMDLPVNVESSRILKNILRNNYYR
ncbi:pre-mRNA-splicing factor CWC22 homolog [Colletes gigas]|uniref:pre-mRNA-splicing factor CWC22 homolog n=1 Tax=Colletes gigas TaxID=935657 RepID=UPI001C9AA0D2|nr:pre-mRNA-splicing factor CWC22 homolog [Colletes gigas]